MLLRAVLTLTLVLLATGARAEAGNDAQPRSSYQLSDGEYSDLKLYMNYARETLEQTLESAQRLGGAKLHARLAGGIRTALEEAHQKSGGVGDVKNELLLFCSVLNRALDIDQFFGEQDGAAASAILYAGIQSALNYFKNDDNVRINATLVPSPDWFAFVRAQIPILLRVSSLSPSQQTRREIVLKTLAWTFRDLNRSINRRDHATMIVQLGNFTEEFRRGLHTLDEGQQTLLETNAELSGEGFQLSANENFPAGNQPGSGRPPEVRTADTSIFPLIGSDTLKNVNNGVTCIGNSCEAHYLSLGAGASFSSTNGAAPATYGSVAALAHAFMLIGNGDKNPFYVSGLMQGEYAVGGPQPMYQMKVDVSMGMAVWGGLYAAFEMNQYEQYKEQFVRLGWAFAFPLALEGKPYVLLRISPGAVVARGGGPDTWEKASENMGISHSVVIDLILRTTKFFLQVSLVEDKSGKMIDAGGTDAAYRREASMMLALPLGLIFPNDEIRINGKVISYSVPDDSFKNITVFHAGLMYQMRF